MKLKLDENLPHDLAAALRRDGHDVHTVVEEQLAGESDPVVVAAATGEGRLRLTLDRGIGDLRRYPPGSHAGILVLRPAEQDPDSILSLIQRLRRAHPLDELRSCVVVVEPRKVRIRRSSSAAAFMPLIALSWHRPQHGRAESASERWVSLAMPIAAGDARAGTGA